MSYDEARISELEGRMMAGSDKGVKEIETCSRCGQPLVELLWSKSYGRRIYILTCDNLDCTD
ncbi:unnamed protein product, partial [marine sediment metagenome]